MKIESVILIAYNVSLLILFFFASHGFNMVYFYFKTFRKRTEDLEEKDFEIKEYPFVTVQLPLYNDKFFDTRFEEEGAKETDKGIIKAFGKSTPK